MLVTTGKIISDILKMDGIKYSTCMFVADFCDL